MNTTVIDAPPAATMQAQQASTGDLVAQAPGALAAVGQSASLVHIIAAAARDTSVDIDKMERLWAMHERLSARAAEEAFNAAMNKAQAAMGRVAVDAANPQTHSTYATYGKLDAAVRPIYTLHGFSISFNEGEDAPEGFARILAYVSHSAGHTRTYKMDMPADGKGAKGGDVMTKTHATGAAHSYGRRYLLKDIFNIAIGEEDNDGNGNGVNGLPPAVTRHPDGVEPGDKLVNAGRAKAMEGMAPLTKWWATLNPRQQKDLGTEFLQMRKAARRADEDAARNTQGEARE